MKTIANQVRKIDVGNSFEKEIIITSSAVDTDGEVVWHYHGVDYLLREDISLGSDLGTKLIIEPGCTLKFPIGGEIWVGYSSDIGYIEAEGTAELPITFTTNAAFPENGNWDGIWFYANAGSGNKFDHCNFSYGGETDNGNITIKTEDGNKVSITNSSFSHSAGYGIYRKYPLDGTPPFMDNNTFSDNTQGDINW
ncbi:MAG: hypothetical protein GQ574_20620 [Crocinitomix sp.]|nr:hypothetical protein [Crocinitomix sp.]